MSKPIERVPKIGDICANTNIELNRSHPETIYYFTCSRYPSNWCSNPCTLEDWARCPFNTEAKPAELKPGTASYIEDLRKLEFESRYKFYYGCQHYLKKSKKEIDPHIAGLNLDDPQQRKKAWLRIVDKFGRPRNPGVE